MSKIALFQHVAREVFQVHQDGALADLMARADAAHVRWQTDGSGYWACSDQFLNGQARGSRYYPRVITAALWMTTRDPRSGAPGATPAVRKRLRHDWPDGHSHSGSSIDGHQSDKLGRYRQTALADTDGVHRPETSQGVASGESTGGN
jgi:hypothetical protein